MEKIFQTASANVFRIYIYTLAWGYIYIYIYIYVFGCICLFLHGVVWMFWTARVNFWVSMVLGSWKNKTASMPVGESQGTIGGQKQGESSQSYALQPATPPLLLVLTLRLPRKRCHPAKA